MEREYRLYRKKLDFRPDAILTAGMLEELDRFPHEVLSLFYQDYCNGIVTGLNFRSSGGCIYLGPGMVCLQGAFYILPQEKNLSEYMGDFLKEHHGSANSWNIVLEPGGREIIKGVPVEYLRFNCEASAGDNVDKLQLCAFREGLETKLPEIEGKDIGESFFSASRLYLLDTPMADAGEATFVSYVFMAARNLLMAKKHKSAADLALLFNLTQKPYLSMTTVKSYIQAMGGSLPEAKCNIFREFFRCLEIVHCEVWNPPQKEEEPAPKRNKQKSCLI